MILKGCSMPGNVELIHYTWNNFQLHVLCWTVQIGMAIIHFIGTFVIYNEASSQLISIRNSITIVILFPLLCIYWLLGSLEMCSLDLVTVYLQNNQEHCCDKIFIGSFRRHITHDMTGNKNRWSYLSRYWLSISFEFIGKGNRINSNRVFLLWQDCEPSCARFLGPVCRVDPSVNISRSLHLQMSARDLKIFSEQTQD